MDIKKLNGILISKINKANREYKLFDDIKKIAIAFSGGKDSAAAIHLLNERNRHLPAEKRLEIHAVHVNMYGKYEYIEQMNVFCEERNIFLHVIDPSEEFERGNCQRCSWVRRKTLFIFAHQNNFTHIIFGHHKDDIAETVMLNILFNREVSTMIPKRTFFENKITVIRPLCFIPEKSLEQLAQYLELKKLSCECVPVKDQKRQKIKSFLKSFGRSSKQVKNNLFYIGLKNSIKIQE